MPSKVEAYTTFDGKIILSKDAAIRHETVERMIDAVPALALIRSQVEANLDALCRSFIDWYPPVEKTTLDLAEDHPENWGTADVAIGLHINPVRIVGDDDDEVIFEGHVCNCPSIGREPKFHAKSCPVYEAWQPAQFPTGKEMADATTGSRRWRAGGILPKSNAPKLDTRTGEAVAG